ncbi:MAG: hypothetical protein RR248_06095 [Clostridia bacterium]
MRLNPGDTAPQSGSYRVCDRNGKMVNTVTIKRGQTLPPTQTSGWYYEMND